MCCFLGDNKWGNRCEAYNMSIAMLRLYLDPVIFKSKLMDSKILCKPSKYLLPFLFPIVSNC